MTSRTTTIQWTDHTMNFWMGCDHVSPGCEHCYAERLMTAWGRDFDTVARTSEATWRKALGWDRQAARDGRPHRVFTCSMSDFFHPDADPWRDVAWAIIRATPHLRWQILSKRPNRIGSWLPPEWGAGWPHVWLGVSVEQATYTYRLEQLATAPAAVRFVSYEPALGPVDFGPWLRRGALDWVIVGGESGRPKDARPMDLEWVREAIRTGRMHDVPVFVKQLGSSWARATGTLRQDWHGGDPALWPEDLRVRDFPGAIHEEAER